MKGLDYDLLVGHDFLMKTKKTISYDGTEVTVRAMEPEDLSEEDWGNPWHSADVKEEGSAFQSLIKNIPKDSELNKDQASLVIQVLSKLRKAFAETYEELPGSSVVNVEVKVKSEPNLRVDGMRLNPVIKEKVRKELKSLLQGSIVEETEGDYWTGFICVPKPNDPGALRPTVDERPLNAISEVLPDKLIKSQEIFDFIGQPQEEEEEISDEDEDELRSLFGAWIMQKDKEDSFYLSMADFKSGFFQLMVPEEFRKFFTFTFDGKLYRFCRLPMGWVNSTAYFARAMKTVLGELKDWRSYVDDTIQRSRGFFRHLRGLLFCC